MGRERPVVLVTAIGTASATAIVTELKKTDTYTIIGADINKEYEIATSKDVDEFFKFPPAVGDQKGYIQFVASFCKEHEVDYYFAVIDEEIENLSRHRALFESMGVVLCIPNETVVETCHYKDRFTRWIREHLPDCYIKTYDCVDQIKNSDYPIFIKPIEGRASIGCHKIENEEELRIAIPAEALGETLIAQEYIEGEIITVDMARSAKTGKHMLVQRRELLRNANGCGIAVEIINDEKLNKICEALMVSLDLNGVVNAEFFCCGDGFKIIEVNPRFSAGAVFSCLAGCRLVQNAITAAEGKDIIVTPIAHGKRFAKRYEVYEM